jgi:hypothetical protein
MYLISSQAMMALLLLLAGIALTLYIMRRRVRLGRRQGKF